MEGIIFVVLGILLFRVLMSFIFMMKIQNVNVLIAVVEISLN